MKLNKKFNFAKNRILPIPNNLSKITFFIKKNKLHHPSTNYRRKQLAGPPEVARRVQVPAQPA